MTKTNRKNLVQFEFPFKNRRIKLFDVNGGRGERKKWIHIFDEVNLVIFVSSLSSVFQQCYHDENSNRLMEDLGLFDEIVNSNSFIKTKIILLFTKTDLFKEKLKYFNLQEVFSDFKPKHISDPVEASEYIKSKFLERAEVDNQERVHTFFVDSFNNSHINFIFNSVFTDSLNCSTLLDFRDEYFKTHFEVNIQNFSDVDFIFSN
jgi:guanine nucleotide-binding protein G(i) subunit alpha